MRARRVEPKTKRTRGVMSVSSRTLNSRRETISYGAGGGRKNKRKRGLAICRACMQIGAGIPLAGFCTTSFFLLPNATVPSAYFFFFNLLWWRKKQRMEMRVYGWVCHQNARSSMTNEAEKVLEAKCRTSMLGPYSLSNALSVCAMLIRRVDVGGGEKRRMTLHQALSACGTGSRVTTGADTRHYLKNC